MKILIGILLEIVLIRGQEVQESYKSADKLCWLKPVLNGEVNYDGNLTSTLPVGGTLEVKCADGFRLSISHTQRIQLTCQADGSWTDSIHSVTFPTCDRIGGCSLPSIANGRVLHKIDGTYMPGDLTFVMCEESYEISFSKSRYIVCQHDGTWTGEFDDSLPTCEAKQCEAPTQISHSSFRVLVSLGTRFGFYPNGTQLYYSCDPGYIPHGDGPALTICQSGTWVGIDQIHCISQVGTKTCTPPSSVANGYYRLMSNDHMFETKYNDEIDSGTTAYVSCYLGYNLNGPLSRTCTNGRWVPTELSSCIPIAQGCSQPPKILSGNYTFGPSYLTNQDILPQGTIAYYSCKTGYKLMPDRAAQLTCKGTEWQGNVPYCERRVSCDKPMDIPDGNWYFVGPYPDYRIGSRVSYQCSDGHKLMGAGEIVCQVSGYWSDNTPKCLLKGKYCSDPGSVANGFYVCKPNGCDNFRVGTEVHFMCGKGYNIEPEDLSILICQPGGYWSGSASSQLRCASIMTTPSQQQVQFLSEPSTLVVLIVTTCGILGLLLLVVIIVGVQRRLRRRVPIPLCPSDHREAIPSVMIQAAVRQDHDRVALIAFPDIDPSLAVLPSYEEAVRSRTPGPRIARFGSELVHSSSIRSNRSDYRLLPHVGLSSISRIGTPGLQVRENASQAAQEQRGGGGDHRRNSIVTTASTMTRDNLSLAFGSVETVNVSDGTSTTVTIGTFESGGSNPSLAASQRAAAGSVASAGSPPEEDVPLLEGGGAGTLGRGARQLIEAPPIPEEEHQDNV